ncbi:MAG: hypothetical protein GWP59_08825, partial [Chlamydiales bacterium]|nr:hypothetical protein [Chlamydiales bacterium]
MSAIEAVSVNSEANNLSTLEAFEDSRDLLHGFTKECFMKMPALFKHADKTFSASKPQFYEKTHLIAYPHLMADGKLKDRGIFLPQSIIADKLKTAIEEDELPLAHEAKHALDKGLCYGLNLMHIYRRFSSEEE